MYEIFASSADTMEMMIQIITVAVIVGFGIFMWEACHDRDS